MLTLQLHFEMHWNTVLDFSSLTTPLYGRRLCLKHFVGFFLLKITSIVMELLLDAMFHPPKRGK
jgi:hypothetical protein